MKNLAIAVSLAIATSFNFAYALPTGENVRSGSAEIVRNGDSVIINQNTPNVAIDWNTFNINRNELVRFNQNGGIALNRVIGIDPSLLFGKLQSDGTVLLLNPNGIIFGKDFVLDTGRFYASTITIPDEFVDTFASNIDPLITFEPDAEGNIINTAGMLKADTIVVGENGEIQLLNSSNVTLTGDITSGNLEIVGKNINIEDGSLTNAGNLSISANRDLSIKNTPIIITAGDAILSSDTDKDYKGMTSIIGSDITVDGNLTFDSPTTGTYFSYPVSEGNIDVGENSITFNGHVEVDDSTLNITTKDIVFGANVDSANSYTIYKNSNNNINSIKNDEAMKSLVKYYYDNYLKNIVYKNFDALTVEEYNEIKSRCLDEYKGYRNRPVPTTDEDINSAVEEYFNKYVKISTLTEPTDFVSLTDAEYNTLVNHILSTLNYAQTDSRETILINWNTAVKAAMEGTDGGSAVGDKYLATITDSLENWRVTSMLEGDQYEYLLGGKTDIVGRSVKAGREFRWYTGIEKDKGNTLFFTSSGEGEGTVHTYAGWSIDPDDPRFVYIEPNNNGPYDQPYVAIGYHEESGNGWADVDNLKNSVKGFIQETNNPRSTINVNLTGEYSELGKVGDSVPITINYIKPPIPDLTPIPDSEPTPEPSIEPQPKPTSDPDPIIDSQLNPIPMPSIEPAQQEEGSMPINEAKNIIVEEYNKSHLYRTELEKEIFLEDGVLLDKEENSKVTNYGLYNVYVNRNKISLVNASALTLPQKPRIEYEKVEYSNEDFKYICNGTYFDIYAMSEKAKERVKNENKFNNEKMALEALYIAHEKMKVDVIKLCEICIHF